MISKGFTLLEVLVAMAIFALVAMSLSSQTQLSAESLQKLRLRAAANTLAANTAELTQLETALPALGTSRQDILSNGQNWEVRTQVETTPRPDMRKLTIDVYWTPDRRHSKNQEPYRAAQLITFAGAN